MDTGTKIYRNYFPIKFGWQCDCRYGKLYPCFRKLMYPGDVFKIHADLLIRYQPMLTPPMNSATARVRFGFVPLRLIEPNTELIITGSTDGKLYTETLPEFPSVFHDLDLSSVSTIQKHSILDELYCIPAGIDLSPSGLLAKLDSDKASPAAYFAKAAARFWWDYYRDENLYTSTQDFESYWNYQKQHLHRAANEFPCTLKKDRITSSLPWQLKAVAAPTIEIQGSGVLNPDYSGNFFNMPPESPSPNKDSYLQTLEAYHRVNDNATNPDLRYDVTGFKFNTYNGSLESKSEMYDLANQMVNDYLNQSQTVNITAAGFNGAQFREMMAQTRIFERLARCGSRYTEYLRANFGIAPADDTMQRAQYLGGFKTHIVTTEVVQTAADGANPVGTLRGHGITHGSSSIKPYMAKEIGIIIGFLDVQPEIIYAQGVDRELTCRSRFDFLNPSFQHLSEQEVRKGEVYFAADTDTDGNLINSDTWGFQPYAQELRTGIKHVVGDMRDSLSFWNQSLIFSSRPQLNNSFISATSHLASFNRPFAVSSTSAYPMIIDFGGVIEAYRPLVKNGTPGLVDHN